VKTFVFFLFSILLNGQSQTTRGPGQFIRFNDPVIALVHVRVIDGTGSPAHPNQTVIVDHGTITAVGNASSTPIPDGARRLELNGNSVYPGLVGVHEHLFYPVFPTPNGPMILSEQPFSAPRLYLASGVTTIRTAGAIEPYADINLKQLTEKGAPGPAIDATAPYIQGPRSYFFQMPVIHSAEEARRFVDYWASAGATSFKAYTNISHDSLAAAIEAAHQHGLKITGHLCSVGFTEAAEMGIDNLEHGLIVDTEFTPGKQHDVCPNPMQTMAAFKKLDVKGPEVQQLIHVLVQHKVAITSTLAVLESSIPGRPPLEQRMLDAMSPQAAVSYLAFKERMANYPEARDSSSLDKEMAFEREFVRAGGLLLAGCDPTNIGGTLAGFGDQRNLELLVEAGFKPEEAIKIYSYNGALYLGRADRIGTIATGRQADLVVVEGDPSAHISDVEKVKYVVKKGLVYDSEDLIRSVRGMVGIQ